ncbi:MAG: cell envelope integrity protein TolA [Gallionella sp.]|nr:cell envelope integrity protein TolA [Gallionella sp.]
MNATYTDNYSLPAGMLALFVHGAFFALLYFGFTWQNQQPAVMSVQLWQSLPDDVVEPQAQPKVVPPSVKQIEPEVQPVQQPVVIKPDIVLPTKKPVPKPVEVKPVEKLVTKPKPPEVKAPPKPIQPSAQELEAARLHAEQAAQAAAVGKVVDEYSGKIHDKIRRNIAGDLSSVPKDALAIFSVTLLPGGTVLSARLTQSSGNALYDNAVERAILKSQPLPLPSDPNMFNRFRELRLKFKPNE